MPGINCEKCKFLIRFQLVGLELIAGKINQIQQSKNQLVGGVYESNNSAFERVKSDQTKYDQLQNRTPSTISLNT